MPSSESAISAFLGPKDICLSLDAASPEEAIRRLVAHIHARHGEFEPEPAIAAVMARERVMSVVMEHELAMPHARLPDIAQPRLAVGIAPAGIPFAPDQAPVKVVLLTLAPVSDPNLFLRVLAAATKALLAPQAVSRLTQAKTVDEVLAVLGVLHQHLPEYLFVRDLMNRTPVVLKETDTLGDAIERFCIKQVMDLPVVNEEGEVKGSIAVEDLLRRALPVHLRWMEDLSPILRFEPFAELLKREAGSKITEFMREDVLVIAPDKPAAQLTKLFLLDERRQILVTEDNKLVGVVNLAGFVRKLFWE